MSITSEEYSTVEHLAQSQLLAYNQSDLDAFCACYHDQVRVRDQQGHCVAEGIDAFRQRYVA